MTKLPQRTPGTAPPGTADGAPAAMAGRGPRFLVLICCSSVFMVSLDSTIVNVALPSIHADFAASATDLQWVVDSYTITLACFLILSGSSGDRFGRRRVFRVGLVLFCVGSLACSLAPSPGALALARIPQAIGGSMLNPVAMAIIVNEFTDRRVRAKVVGVWGSVVGLSMAVGPLFGGLVVGLSGWRGVFWINVPIALVVLVSTRVLPESRGTRIKAADPVGQLLVIAFLLALVVGLMNPESAAPFPMQMLLILSVGIGVLLIAWELHHRDPLIDPRLFGIPAFSLAIVSAVLGFAALSGFLFLNSLYLQNVRGLTAIEAGLALLPMAITACLAPVWSGALVAKFGPPLPLVLSGLGLATAGIVIGTVDSPALWLLGVAYAAFGCGFGMINPPITTTVVSVVPSTQSGLASAIVSTGRQAGAAAGVAILGSRLPDLLSQGAAESLLQRQWLIAAAGALIILGALVGTPKRAEGVHDA